MEADDPGLGLPTFFEPFRPIIDEEEFSNQPLELFKTAGTWNSDKEMIIGTNNGELDILNATPLSISRQGFNVSVEDK